MKPQLIIRQQVIRKVREVQDNLKAARITAAQKTISNAPQSCPFIHPTQNSSAKSKHRETHLTFK